ncbi:baseplate J/gp47 family protein [Pseudoduganella sp. RAF53_2]|uniref:baseplate J/gp47 family protein n=1 Tax=unclassified Pseudoduganella TaxID=2637179 RepID=UPI003F9942C7
MPFTRPTLTALQALVAADIAAEVGGADALLRFSSLGATGRAQAGLANLHYGYLDWIAKQAVPFTCTDEFLEGWAALKSVLRQPARAAAGQVKFSGAAGTPVPLGAGVVRSDGVPFVTTAAAVVGVDGTAVIPVAAVPDPSGLTGAFGNTAKGATMTLAQSIAGVQSNGVVDAELKGGADLESNDNLRSRMLIAFQEPPQGGAKGDYEAWAKQAPGVTRAWCKPNGFGAGTVVLFVMLDEVRSSTGGFPIGADGVAALEARGVAAAGDQLAVANYLFGVQAAVGLVYVAAPMPHQVDLQIAGLPESVRAAATAAVDGLLKAQGAPGGTLPFGSVWSAIAGAVAGNFFTVTPSSDVVCPPGYIPVLGQITYMGA